MPQWIYIQDNPLSPWYNMAKDEALMEWVQQNNITSPILRLYQWDRTTISIGRHQYIHKDIHQEICHSNKIAIVRRPTGGRAVFHDRELTYSVIIPPNNELGNKNIQETYRTISGAILAGLRNYGLPVTAEPTNKANREYIKNLSCFASTTQYEITLNGHKIVGSAQWRNKGTVLQQGSILLSKTMDPTPCFPAQGFLQSGIEELIDNHIDINILYNSIQHGFSSTFGVEMSPWQEDPVFAQKANHLMLNKYQTQEWLNLY